MNRLLAVLANWATCPRCGWWAQAGHVCHPIDRR